MAKRPVLVELFTSEGCSSCPPADIIIGELAQYEDVLPLSFHVDYWDYLGWKDMMASPLFTKRQRAYKKSMGTRSVYTPQVIVDGKYQGVGADKKWVYSNIVRAKKEMENIKISARKINGSLEVNVDAAAEPVVSDLLVIGYEKMQESVVIGGENAGKNLKSYNVVKFLEHISNYQGNQIALRIPAKPYYESGLAIILQERDMGRILGVTRVKY